MIITKSHVYGGMFFQCFSKLYDSLVQSLISYGTAIWGHTQYICIDQVQYQASRYFLGVGHKTPLAALYGETGWSQPQHHVWMCIGRQWCRLVNMCDSRLNKHVFTWAKTKKNWTKKALSFFGRLYLANEFTQEAIDKRNVMFKLNTALSSHDEQV